MTRTTTLTRPSRETGLVAVPSRSAAVAEDLDEVRAWARSRGYPVDERGTLPLAVLRTYRRVKAA